MNRAQKLLNRLNEKISFDDLEKKMLRTIGFPANYEDVYYEILRKYGYKGPEGDEDEGGPGREAPSVRFISDNEDDQKMMKDLMKIAK